MFTNSKLAKSVRLAMAFGAATTALTAPQAFAAEEEEEVERIEVTGSRIKRADLEGASPVTILTAEDMKVEGNFTVADALRGSSFNSFGSFSERSGSSAQSQATLNLRGAGSNRTLVLLDGKRLPGSPTLGGQSANLNSIPFAAVERIEILTDGASSTYGSDAIAGVVNIILKKDFEGLVISGGAGWRDRDADVLSSKPTSKEFSILGGYSTDKGNITFAIDHQSREGISDGARDFTAARAEDLDGDGDIEIYSDETDGWSWYGATVFDPGFNVALASPLCDDLIAEYGDNTFKRMSGETAWGPGSEVCAYAYANVSYNRASLDRTTLFVDANYEVAEDVEFFTRAMFVQNESFGRYAPPAAPWSGMSADNPHNPHGVDGAYGLFRWVGIGTRDGNVYDYNQDYLMGLRGFSEVGGLELDWEVYYHRNVADNKSVGQYYLSYGGLAYNEANGIDLGSDAGIANMKATTLTEDSSTFDQFYAGAGFDAFELPGGAVAHYVGMERMEIDFASIYDGQSAAGLVGGSAGNSAWGERTITAMFYEAALPVNDDVEVNLAARYDDYSDFGDNVAPKASVRWQALENLVVRASYSEAFRAPGLDELNAATTFSAEGALDYISGQTNERQYDTYYKSNPNLGAETSEYLNFGLAYDVSDELSVKVDYFDLAIDNVVQTKTVNGLINDQANGLLTPLAPGADVSNETFYLIRANGSPTGNILEAGTGYFNGTGFGIEGLDLTVTGNFETEFGAFTYNVVNSFILSYANAQGGVDTAGWSDQPDHRAVITLGWSMDAHSVTWNTNYIGSTSEFESYNATTDSYDISGELDSWTIHNISYSYSTENMGRISLSVSNLADEDPVLSSAGSYTNASLYNNFGRDIRLAYTISF
jgi:iron complex outermembrane receptor protein